MAITKSDIKNIRDALRPDFQAIREEMDRRFRALIVSLPDWSQFVTKIEFHETINDIKDRLIRVEDVAVGISKRFDQDLTVMQMQLSLHREWLQKHDKQFEQMNIVLKRKGSD